MKKFVKVSLILAGSFFAVGILLCLISTMIGGRKLMHFIVENEELVNKIETFVGSFHGVAGSDWALTFDGDKVLVEDVDLGERFFEDTFQSYPVTDVKNLNIEIGAGEFVIEEKETADDNIEIAVAGVGDCEYDVKDGTLYVKGFNKIIANSGIIGEITLSVPKDSHFEKVYVKIGAGTMELSGVNAKELEASVSAGEVIMERIKVDEFEAEIGAGELAASEVVSTNAELTVSLGECVYEGTITGNLEAECDMGNLEISLTGKETDHNYSVECDAGNIDIADRSMTGLSAEKVIDNGALSNFNISCDLGNITVEFAE